MKALKSILFISLILSFTGCLKTDYEQRIESFAVGIYNPVQGIFTTDINLKLNVLNSTEFNAELKSNEVARLLLYFYVDKFIDETSADITVLTAYDITMPLIVINEENQDSLLRNDPVDRDSIWIAFDYLTVNFYFARLDKSHNFFLSKNPEDQEEGKINLKFHHSAKGDQTYQTYNTYRSVLIKDFKEIYPEKDSVEIVISVPVTATSSEERSIWYITK